MRRRPHRAATHASRDPATPAVMGLFGGLLMALTAVAGLSPLAAVEITLPAI